MAGNGKKAVFLDSAQPRRQQVEPLPTKRRPASAVLHSWLNLYADRISEALLPGRAESAGASCPEIVLSVVEAEELLQRHRSCGGIEADDGIVQAAGVATWEPLRTRKLHIARARVEGQDAVQEWPHFIRLEPLFGAGGRQWQVGPGDGVHADTRKVSKRHSSQAGDPAEGAAPPNLCFIKLLFSMSLFSGFISMSGADLGNHFLHISVRSWRADRSACQQRSALVAATP